MRTDNIAPQQNEKLSQRLHHLLFSLETRTGKIMSAVWSVITLASVFFVLFNMMRNDENALVRHSIEIFFLGAFFLEYVLRAYTSPKRQHYVTSFMGLIDLSTTLSLFCIVAFPNSVENYHDVIQIMRIFCLLRLTKFLHDFEDIIFLRNCLYQARSKLYLFSISIFIVIFIAGGIEYIVEGPENGFTSIGVSIYWAIVTITGVGYGDITPKTPLGRTFAALVIFTGYLALAIPISILSSYVMRARNKNYNQHCPVCDLIGHEKNAHYCRNCGAVLDQ